MSEIEKMYENCNIKPDCIYLFLVDGNGENEPHKIYCQDCTDCVIKQVIEKCGSAVSDYSNLEILRTACETSEAYGKANIAEQILQLFDIEEINK